MTGADAASNRDYVARNYFSANQSFICDSTTIYPDGDSSTVNWSWVGNQQYPLNTKGNPGIWIDKQQVNQDDIYIVTGADAASNRDYVARNYFSANQLFICDSTTTYPDGDSSTDNWSWVGNQQYPLNTKGNPGIWILGQQVNPGDIYMVTGADAARNGHYTARNYFLANQSFNCDVSRVYPYGDYSTVNWSWVGNQQYPLNTKGNPGIWIDKQQVNPGDIYITTAIDVTRNPSDKAGDYFLAKRLFMCSIDNKATYYPNSGSSTDYWGWLENK
ncbi:Uncharacterised protein [Serratia quinivorans]|nr:Uncharacterised protein [Serratia quinivorans]